MRELHKMMLVAAWTAHCVIESHSLAAAGNTYHHFHRPTARPVCDVYNTVQWMVTYCTAIHVAWFWSNTLQMLANLCMVPKGHQITSIVLANWYYEEFYVKLVYCSCYLIGSTRFFTMINIHTL